MNLLSLRNPVWPTVLAAMLTACQPTETFQPQPDKVVRFGSQSSPARVAAGSQKYIVIFKSDRSVSQLLPEEVGSYDVRIQRMTGLISRLLGADIAGKTQEVYTTALKGFAAQLSDADLIRLRRLPFIDQITPDQEISLALPAATESPLFKQVLPWGISRVGGPRSYTGPNKAWIIDTGIDFEHPDLNVNVALSRNFVNPLRSADDDDGHGTHVAGIVAAKDNSFGVVGVAAGAPVVAVKVFSAAGRTSTSIIIAAVDYVAITGVVGDVANMSLGGPVDVPLDNAVKGAASKGIKFALSAGNDSQNANNKSPARTEHPNVYTVSAQDINDRFAWFSNYGNPPVDYAAPGVSVLSTWLYNGYRTMNGTSMAAPHVAGILLFGTPVSRGPVIGDPDGNPDPMAKLPTTTLP